MPIAVLPQRNTFVHFHDQDDFNRSASCPGTYVPLTRTSSLPVNSGSSCGNTVPLAMCPCYPHDGAHEVPAFGSTEASSTWQCAVGADNELSTIKRAGESNPEEDLTTLRRTGSCCRPLRPVPNESDAEEDHVPTSAQGESSSTRSDNDEDDQLTLGRTDSISTTYAWPLYKMRTLALPILAISSSDDASTSSCKPLCRTGSHNSPKRMCRTLRAESECRERLTDYLAAEQSPTNSEDPQSPEGCKPPTVTATRRWEDISDDEETPVHLKPNPVLGDNVQPIGQVHSKSRWADLSDDEQTPLHRDFLEEASNPLDLGSSAEEQILSAQAKNMRAHLEARQDKMTDSHSTGSADIWAQVNKQARQQNNKKTQPKAQAVSKASGKLPMQAPNGKPRITTRKAEPPRVQSQARLRRNPPQKLLCRYHVGIEQGRDFNVVRKLLGDHGSHMKAIVENTGAKLRVRGRGSGFLEGPDQTEASAEPLMVCISAASCEGFEKAVQEVETLLKSVQDQYREFCNDRNLPLPELTVMQRKQPDH